MQEDTPIAIIGFAYRAPGCGRKGIYEYLSQAKSAWSRVPADRFEQDAFNYPNHEKGGTFSGKGAHFLPDDIYAFDAPFFSLRPDEVRVMDPQHRFLLECTFEASESAGLSLNDLAGANIGVFSANGMPDFTQSAAEDLPSATAWSATGGASCMFANRLSYFFDLGGPSITMDAACASSSYAIHTACQSLKAGECDAAFVGGSNLIMGPNEWILLDTMGALSREGKSFSYDSKADGFGRGEGGACIFIKRLDDALEAGDPIRAVIRGSATNHVGRSEGITMPRRSAQERVLRKAHAQAGLDPSDTAVVEGHGTGTQVGDPIEAGAFVNVLGKGRTADNPLYIGSLKSNFGHLEHASGILAMIKAIMMLEKGIVFPCANFEEINPKIEGSEILKVVTTPQPWPTGALRRVIVTNFGFGGSNAAVIVDEAPRRHTNGIRANGSALNGSKTNGTSANGTRANGTTTNGTTTNGASTNGASINGATTNGASINGATTNGAVPNGTKANGTNVGSTKANVTTTNGHSQDSSSKNKRLFVLSAKSEKSFSAYLTTFAQYLEEAPGTSDHFMDLAYTLGQRRTNHTYRLAVAAESLTTLRTALESAKPNKAKNNSLAFVFTGQGAQYAQMAIGLLRYKPFAEAIMQAGSYLRDFGASWSLKDELDKDASNSRINTAEISQPVCTCIQLALICLLQAWNVIPAAVTGHSSGEIAAAFAAGLVSFQTAIAIAYFRGLAASEITQKGAMLALGIGPEEAATLIEESDSGYATVAAINSPSSVTISGDVTTVEKIHEAAEARGLFARRLKVELAYHSKHMEVVAASYLAKIKSFCNNKPIKNDQSPIFVSSVTGKIETWETMDASYWINNLHQPVRFAEAIEVLLSLSPENSGLKKAPDVLVEVGPHSALKNPIKQTVNSLKHQGPKSIAKKFTYMESLIRGTDSNDAMLSLAGNLFTSGFSVSFEHINHTNKQNARVLTELPPYEWDKSTRYIAQSRVVKDKLHPGVPYDTLLGWKIPNSGGAEHVFRQVFKLDELPWIRDHAVAGGPVFPLTGYLSLAAEAVRRVASTLPASMVFQEVHARRSLSVEEDKRAEITTRLRPFSTGTETSSSTVWTFEILTWSEVMGWTTHCHGQVEAEDSGLNLDSPTFSDLLPLINSPDLQEREVGAEYTTQDKGGIIYGPEFRRMDKLWIGPGHTVMEMQLRDADLETPSAYGSVVSVDPPTLDSMIHGFGPLQETPGGKRPTHMPVYVSRLRVSNHIPGPPKQRFTSVMRLLSQDTKAGNLQFSAAVLTQNSDGALMPVIEWEAVKLIAIAGSDTEDEFAALPQSYYWDHVPSLDLATNEEIRNIVGLQHWSDQDLEGQRGINVASVYYMTRALETLDEVTVSKLPAHLLRFLKWAKTVVDQHQLKSTDKKSILASVPRNAHGELICRMGEHLPSILRGETQPLELMLKDNLLAHSYEDHASLKRSGRDLANFVRHLHDVHTEFRILEVGAGTGSATLPILEQLAHGPEGEMPSLLSYTFTDISSGFFEKAGEKLGKFASSLVFKKLDITQDPLAQGFNAEEFDLVIASNVLHATPNIVTTVDNVRKLLRPNGKLVLLESNTHQPEGMIYALLPGWWLSEDEYRSEEGPNLSVDKWNQVFSARGFSGVEASFDAYSGTKESFTSVIYTTRAPIQEEDETIGRSVTICGPMMDDEEQEFAQLVVNQVTEGLGVAAEVKPFLELDIAEDQWVVFIDSPRNTFMRDMSAEEFEVFKATLLGISGLVWVVPEGSPPDAEFIKGFLRSLRTENESRNYLSLEQVPCDVTGATAIARLTNQLLHTETPSRVDHDFIWKDGMFYLARYKQLTQAKEGFAAEAGTALRQVQSIWNVDGSVELTVDTAGSPDNIYFARQTDVTSHVGEDEILVKVEAAGVNFRDLLLILGSIPWTKPGFEGAGTILQTGSNVKDLKPGDRVYYATLQGGAFSTYARIPAWQASKIPEGVSSAAAASIPVAYATAYMALMNKACLQKGERILIHAASGAVGQACIVLAQHVGATIFATAGSPTKREFLTTTFGIPGENIFSSRTPAFRDGIIKATQGYGVDVVVNSLSGNLLSETWSLMADFGRFIEIGKRDLLQNSNLAMRPFDRNVTFSGIDLRTFFKKKPVETRECLDAVNEWFKKGIIVPIQPVTPIPVSQIAMGLRKLQSGHNIGKIVVTMGDSERVLAEVAPPKALVVKEGKLLKTDATYVISGGTTGIGLSLGQWMLDNGAKNLVLLGRSGDSRPAVKSLIEKHEGTDVTVRAYACDVGAREDLISVKSAIKDLPPVKGVIHGALYLRDAIFENTTYQDWLDINGPRVQGAWNFHRLFHDLDFFIPLASFLGAVGNIGQSIYAGTSTFYDALSNYRNANGQHTVSISLPLVIGMGYAHEHDMTQTLKDTFAMFITRQQIETLVKGAIIGPSTHLNRDGKAVSVTHVSGEVRLMQPWQAINPFGFHRLIAARQRDAKAKGGASDGGFAKTTGLQRADEDTILEALMIKVSLITMIDRDEVEADLPLTKYSLDSLVSVELRNWIKREVGVELALTRIVGSANLAALAAYIVSERDGTTKTAVNGDEKKDAIEDDEEES